MDNPAHTNITIISHECRQGITRVLIDEQQPYSSIRYPHCSFYRPYVHPYPKSQCPVIHPTRPSVHPDHGFEFALIRPVSRPAAAQGMSVVTYVILLLYPCDT
jgi:hypothetical protein